MNTGTTLLGTCMMHCQDTPVVVWMKQSSKYRKVLVPQLYIMSTQLLHCSCDEKNCAVNILNRNCFRILFYSFFRYSEKSMTKCIGITIETRPDYCLRKHIR